MDGNKENPQAGKAQGAKSVETVSHCNILEQLGTFGKAAIEYAGRGWFVFPLKPKTKKPLTLHGHKDVTTDHAVIIHWWTKWSDANVGIATGSISKIVVLDIDQRNGGNQSLEEIKNQYGELPQTPVERTADGHHCFFQYPPELTIDSDQDIAPGIDIKANKGYIVATPSIHPDGDCYKWLESQDPEHLKLAALPAWLIALITKEKKNEIAYWTSEGVPEGSRNSSIFRFACSLRAKNIDQHDAWVLVEKKAKNCQPPLSLKEASQCLKNAWRYDTGFTCEYSGPNWTVIPEQTGH